MRIIWRSWPRQRSVHWYGLIPQQCHKSYMHIVRVEQCDRAMAMHMKSTQKMLTGVFPCRAWVAACALLGGCATTGLSTCQPSAKPSAGIISMRKPRVIRVGARHHSQPVEGFTTQLWGPVHASQVQRVRTTCALSLLCPADPWLHASLVPPNHPGPHRATCKAAATEIPNLSLWCKSDITCERP